jgi:hypothetical protein
MAFTLPKYKFVPLERNLDPKRMKLPEPLLTLPINSAITVMKPSKTPPKMEHTGMYRFNTKYVFFARYLKIVKILPSLLTLLLPCNSKRLHHYVKFFQVGNKKLKLPNPRL